MAVEQMNISLSPRMARFIRGKVKKGDYANISEVVRDAIRRLQEAEASKKERAGLASLETALLEGKRERIRRAIQQGIKGYRRGPFLRSATPRG